jgi:hypothetical protein
LDPKRPVRVFKNWKLGCWNVMQDGRMCASARQVRLAEVEFRVRESGRQRALREGKRNVHAYAIGLLVESIHPEQAGSLGVAHARSVIYDPWRFATFVDRDSGGAVHFAADVLFDEQGVSYAGAASDPEVPRAA